MNHRRQEAGEDGRHLPEEDARPGELGLGLVVLAHLGRERLVRDDLHRVDELEQDVADEVVPEPLPRHPHDGERRQQGDRGEDEEPPPPEPPAQPRAAEVVGDVADDGRRDGVEQPRDDEDQSPPARR